MYIYILFFLSSFLRYLRFPSVRKKLLKKKKSMTTIPISGQRECVNTVHRPEEKFKAEFVFFHRKCLLKANEDCDVRDLTTQ